MIKNFIKIIVPVYKSDFSPCEEISLNQCRKVLNNYPLVFVKPESLRSEELLEKFPEFQIESFPDHYFVGKNGYNQLMLSSDFYGRFYETEYILIYQTDAYIFRDELKYWCGMSYDYVGAPWIQKERNPVALFFYKRKIKKKKYRKEIILKVGNGGFSLRKIAPFMEISLKEKDLINTYTFRDSIKKDFIPEDVFWALEPHRLGYEFKIPDYKEALKFAFDQYPAECFQITNELPMGCHAWNRTKGRKFWEKYISVESEKRDSNPRP